MIPLHVGLHPFAAWTSVLVVNLLAVCADGYRLLLVPAASSFGGHKPDAKRKIMPRSSAFLVSLQRFQSQTDDGGEKNRTATRKGKRQAVAKWISEKMGRRPRNEVLNEFGTGTPGNSFPVIRRYAQQIQQKYDVQLLPDGLEVKLYSEIVKTGAVGAFESLYENVNNISLLGHPLKLRAVANLAHQPPTPQVEMEDCEEFVSSVLRDSDVGLRIIPRRLETEIYRNAMVTAIYLMQDTLTNFSVRFFGTQYTFEFGRPRRGWRSTKAYPVLSNAGLRTLVKDELKAPALLRAFPGLAVNTGKVAVALASEVIGSAELNFLGLPLRFSLQPKPDEAEEILSLLEAGKGAAEIRDVSPETLEIIENYVEMYMANWQRWNATANPFFFSQELERDMYVGFLSTFLRNLENSIVCEVLGMDVVLSVGRGARDEQGRIQPPNLQTFKVPSDFVNNRKEIESFVDWLLADPMYNIKAVPDSIERAIYVNVFELFSNIVAGALSTLEVDILGREVTVKLSEASRHGRGDFSRVKRFRPSPEVLLQLARKSSSVPALQEVLMNAYSFVLAFAAYELNNVDITLVGRKLEVSLGTPSELDDSLAKLAAVEESEFNVRLREALSVLVKEMMGRAQDESKNDTDADIEDADNDIL